MPSKETHTTRKKKHTKLLIVLAVIVGVAIISAGVTVYLTYSHNQKVTYLRQFGGERGNFTFNNETLSQTISVMNSSDAQTVDSYCQQSMNIFYCRYYCTRVNPNDQACGQLPMPQFNGNFTRGALPQ